MVTEITNNIEISVVPSYRKDLSNAKDGRFIFSYHIAITNHSAVPVKLLGRSWYIFDSIGQYNEVKGDGVVGKQPVIEPGGTHEYESYCELLSDFGTMHGHYDMVRL